MPFEWKDTIFYAIQQLDAGKNTIYIISQLQGIGLREDLLGPVMEILASNE